MVRPCHDPESHPQPPGTAPSHHPHIGRIRHSGASKRELRSVPMAARHPDAPALAVAAGTIREHAEAVDRRGYTILEGAIEADLVDALLDDLARLERELRTHRRRTASRARRSASTTCSPTARCSSGSPCTRSVLPIVERRARPRVPDLVAVVDRHRSRRDAQPIHADDHGDPARQAAPPTVCNSMWALTDFTEANGATRLVPGSHTRAQPGLRRRTTTRIPAEMAKGSVLVWHGSLWHGGGANRPASGGRASP